MSSSSSSSSSKTTPYVGYNKMMRLEASVNKTLTVLGSTVDLRYANYHKIEKLALLLSIERVLRARVNNTEANYINGNISFIAHVYRVLLQIADRKPLIIGVLDRGRFFSLLLLDDCVAGRRLLKKQNVRAMLVETFPYCFNDNAPDRVNFRLARLCGFIPRVATAAASAPVEAITFIDSLPDMIIAGALMFAAGAAYSWLIIEGLKRL